MPSGKVKWFNAKKGYGFISEDKTDRDIFLHVSSLEKSKLRILKENQRLRFEIKEENAKLHTLLQNNEHFIDSSLSKNENFNYIAAKVINNSIKSCFSKK